MGAHRDLLLRLEERVSRLATLSEEKRLTEAADVLGIVLEQAERLQGIELSVRALLELKSWPDD